MENYKIQLLDRAYDDLVELIELLSNYYPNTAVKKYDAIMDAISKLSHFPNMCEVYWKRPQFRLLSVENYLIFYQVNESEKMVEVYRILYAKRNIAEMMG